MHAFTATILAASAFFSASSAGLIFVRQVCGAAPAGTVAQTPLSQPAGITTANNCATQCKANPTCKSFLFGLNNGADKCMLFSVAGSSIPPQTGLVAYDIACTNFPAVVPTATNPGGLANSNPGTAANNNRPGAAKQNGRRQQKGGATGNTNGGATNNAGAAGNNNNNNGAAGNNNNNNGAAGNNNNNGAAGNNNNNGAAGITNQGTHANPMNAIPAGNPNPISTPAAGSLAACLALCKGNSACVAYTFVSGACKLFG